MGLDVLRRQLAIIPQDPVLFSGSLRTNLDPAGRCGDGELWEALRSVQLEGFVKGLPGKLARQAAARLAYIQNYTNSCM